MSQFIHSTMSNDSKFSYIAVTSVSFLAFRVFYHLVKAKISLPSGHSPSKEWLYRNTLISFLHACVSSVWSIYCFHDNPAMLNDMIKDCSLASTYLLAFLIGYTAHDTWDIVAHDCKGSPGLIIHHVVIIAIAIFVVWTKQFVPFATCLCVIEINSVFLHLRRLMRFHGGNHSQLAYNINLGALFVTFAALRFIFLFWLTGYFASKVMELMHFSHFLLGIFGFFVLIVINLILFVRLWRTEFVARKPRKKTDHRNGFIQEKFT